MVEKSNPPESGGPGPALGRLVRDLLSDLDRQVESFIVAAREIEGYSSTFASGVPTEDEVRHLAYPSMEYMLRLIGGQEMPGRLENIAETVGRMRAEEGFALTWLMEGIRENFRIIWTALLARAGPEDRDELLQSAFRVWEAVEHYGLGVVRAYQQTELELARRRQDVRSAWFHRLLEDGGHTSTLQHAANVLNFDVAANFTVAVAHSLGNRWLERAARELQFQEVPCHHDDTQHGEVLVAQIRGSSRSLVDAALAAVPCCVASARTLSGVAQAVRYAAVVSQLLSADRQRRPTPLGSAWLAVVADKLTDGVGETIRADVLAQLDKLNPGEADILRQTLIEHLVGEGTAVETARRLFCHRNTVLNRLRRFSELTGLDVMRPRDAALVVLALCHDSGLEPLQRVRLLIGE